MSPIRILGAAVLATLVAGAAAAQPSQPPVNDPNAYPDQSSLRATPAERMGVPASGVVLLSSPTPPSEAWRLKAGDPNVISNAPVPDTRANRARYGQPLSNAGRRTAPIG